MKDPNFIQEIVDDLCKPENYKMVFHRTMHDVPMPSVEELSQIVEILRSIIFPGYFGHLELTKANMSFYIGTNIDRLYKLLADQIKRGYCFACIESAETDNNSCTDCEIRSKDTAEAFLKSLPKIRQLLETDVEAAYEGDPAAKSHGEAIFCYPSIKAMTNHRIAHELLRLEIPLIPRIISEMAHSETGIDIHPGATINEKCFIDHGTGVVIGETCEIGKNVRIYQGVTLGAKSFPLDENGNPIKGIPRHPIVEDDVIVYAQATVLGRVTIGKGSTIGGNVWVTEDVPQNARLIQSKAVQTRFINGAGI